VNVLQIMRQARFEADTIRAGNTESGLWTAEELLWTTNTAMDRTARLLRLAGSNILTRALLSSASGLDLISEVYSPTLNIRITAGQRDYTLPPDFVRIATIRPSVASTGFEGVRFRAASLDQDSWVDLMTIPTADLPNADNMNMVYNYVVLGQRTLRITPTPQDQFDIEITYHYRPPRLRYYSVGTVQRTSGLEGVSGSGTSWLTYGLRPPAELLVGVTTTTGVTMDAYYPTIDAIDTDTTLTLARASTTTDAVGQNYTIAMVPLLPEEHHTWLAQLVAAMLYRKVDQQLAATAMADLGQQLLDQVVPEITMRQLQDSLVAEAFEIWR
jgi:hypothetical protein